MKFFLAAFTYLMIHFNAEAQNTFQKIYIEPIFSDWITGICENSDQSFIVSGQYYSWGHSVLFKINSNGDTLWTKVFKDTLADDPYLIKSLDGGYVLTAVQYNSIESKTSIVKTDSSGNILWAKLIGGNYPGVKSIIQLSDSGFMLTGEVLSHIFLIKCNSNGDTVWTKLYGINTTDYAGAVRETSDRGFVIGAETQILGSGFIAYCIIKTDSVGNIEWSKTFDNNSAFQFDNNVILTFDGGYVLSGTDGFLKLDSAGNLLWKKRYIVEGIYPEIHTIIQTLDSGFAESAFCWDSLSNVVMFILKADKNGDLEWCKGFVMGEYSIFSRMKFPLIQTSDSGFALGGTKYSSFSSDSSGMYFVKTDKEGNSLCNQQSLQVSPINWNVIQTFVTPTIFPTSFTINPWAVQTGYLGSVVALCSSSTFDQELKYWNSEFSVSPIPTTDFITIGNKSKSIHEIQIYNLIGEILFFTEFNSTRESITINCEHFPKGIYFVKATFDFGSIVKKIVIQ